MRCTVFFSYAKFTTYEKLVISVS